MITMDKKQFFDNIRIEVKHLVLKEKIITKENILKRLKRDKKIE